MQGEDQEQEGDYLVEDAAAAEQPPMVPMEVVDEDTDISHEDEQQTDEDDMSELDCTDFDDGDLDGMDYNYYNESDELFDYSDDSDEEKAESKVPRVLRRFPRTIRKPPYSFKPLRLINVNHKLYKTVGEYPVARSGHRVIASGSNLYSLGGYNPSRSELMDHREHCRLFQELWCYNFAANCWKLIFSPMNTPHMPKELASNALTMHNNVLISHGGTGFPFGEICSNDCYVYTTGPRPFISRVKVGGDLPTAQYGPGIVIHNNYMYTIGGTTGFDYSCDVYRLNFKTRMWENVYICRPEMRDDPEGRYRHEVVYDGVYIYVLGGGTSNTVYDLQRIPAFNLEMKRWEYFDTLPDPSMLPSTPEDDQEPGYPQPRKCFSCVQHTTSNGDIEAFITGGMQAENVTYFSDIWKLNLRSKQWCCIQTALLPHPLFFHAAAHAGNGCMYIFGGIEYNKKELRRRNDLLKMWMTIPKLSEICWDALTYYNEQLNRYDSSTLIAAGIPKEFVKRLSPPYARKFTSAYLSKCPYGIAMLPARPPSQSEYSI